MQEITYWVVDEAKLPSSLSGMSDQEKYERLVNAVEAHGTVVAELRIRVDVLIKCLEAIDLELGNTGFLPVFTFNNSPHNVLGDDSDCPPFGYYDVEQTKDLRESLEELPARVVNKLVSIHGFMMEKVLGIYRAVAKEAAEKKGAIAIIHE